MPMSGIIITPEGGTKDKLYIEVTGDQVFISDHESITGDSGQWISFDIVDAPEIVKAINDLTSR